MNRSMEKRKNFATRLLHHNMALVGGFLGGYAILLHSDFLGNAQTSNLIFIVMQFLDGNFFEMMLRIGAAMLYIFATIMYVFIKNKTNIRVKRLSILIDTVCIVILSFIPENVNVVLALYPIFFAMSFQWNSFPGSEGYTSSTIFSTNNLRQASLSFGEFLCDKDEKHLHKMFFFLGSLAGFHLGVFFSYFAVKMFRVQGVWFGLIPIITACAINLWEEKMIEEYSEKINTNYSNLNCKSA